MADRLFNPYRPTLPALDVPRRSPSSHRRATPAALPELIAKPSAQNFISLTHLPGFTDLHPDLPDELCAGALDLIATAERLFTTLAGLDACTIAPAAGPEGAFAALAIIRAFHKKHGSDRKKVLITDADGADHAAACLLAGYQPVIVEPGPNGILETATITQAIADHGREIAALWFANPNRHGLFETHGNEISEQLHGVGAQIFLDGAYFAGLFGMALPRDLGADLVQFPVATLFALPDNLAAPIAVRAHLAPFLPDTRSKTSADSIGKVRIGEGFLDCIEAVCAILSAGSEGLTQTSRDAVLTANYLKRRLAGNFPPLFAAPSLHRFTVRGPDGGQPITIQPPELESLAALETFVASFPAI